MAMILITHDLGVVAGRTDEVAVMYAGRIVERAPTRALFKDMRSPYTEALMAAIPKLHAPPHTRLAGDRRARRPIRRGRCRAARSRRAAAMRRSAAGARRQRSRRRDRRDTNMPAGSRRRRRPAKA